MTPAIIPHGAWPRQMTAALAAGYCGEPSAEAFRRGVDESLYPKPTDVRKKGERWLKDDLDRALERLHRAAAARVEDLL